MASSNPPIKATALTYRVALEDQSAAGSFKANPTIATGDFKISKDGGALANLTTLPTNDPAGSIWVTIPISATESNADSIQIQGVDQTSPKEWCDIAINIPTTAS